MLSFSFTRRLPQTMASRTYPVVHLSGIGPIDENAADTMGLEITFERDCDWSELGNDDLGDEPDSNSEGYYANDYPEVTLHVAYCYSAREMVLRA